MNRGVAKRPLFENRQDLRYFMAQTAQQVRSGRIQVYSYSLMTTHFHMLVRSPHGDLSEAMRLIQNSYSREFNRKHKRDGTLIRGRFTSKPVETQAYRTCLLRYIDNNPVKAGLVERSALFPFGSARHYFSTSFPPWMERDIVQADACLLSNQEHYSPDAYRMAFGGSQSIEGRELVSARLSSTAQGDVMDDLIGSSPRSVQLWLQRKARLADGCTIGLPVCGRTALERAIEGDLLTSGPWEVHGRRTYKDASELCQLGFLRDLSGYSWKSIALPASMSINSVRRRTAVHRELLASDSKYAARAASIAQTAAKLCV